MREGASSDVDRQADMMVDVLTRLSAIEKVGHVHGPGGGYPAGRNILHNGQLAVNQRGVPGSGLAGHTAGWFADRHYIQNFGIGVATLYYDTTANFFPVPAGRPRPANMQFIQMTTGEAAGAVAAADYMRWQQGVEGRNIQHLEWGTAAARPVTFSFDCYSTVAATYVCELYRVEATNRQVCQSFAVPAGFSTVTLTFPGDVTTIVTNDTAARLFVFVYVGAGSNLTSTPLSGAWRNFVGTAEATGVTNNFAATAGNNFALTNLQLEPGAVATPYELRSYAADLLDGLRYFERFDSLFHNQAFFGAGLNYLTTAAVVTVPFTVRKRSSPTVAYSAANTFALYNAAGTAVALTAIATHNAEPHQLGITCTVASGLVAGDAQVLHANAVNTATIDASAEI